MVSRAFLASASSGRISLIRSEGRPANSVAFEEALVSFFIEAATLLGAPKSLAAIYGICFASHKPLTFSEIRSRLAISAGSISQGLRVLREIGALRAIPGPTTRRDRFEPDLEIRKVIAHFLENRLQKQLEQGHIHLRKLSAEIPVQPVHSSKVLRERLKILQSWHDKARALLPMTKIFLRVT